MRISRLTPEGLDQFIKFNQAIDPTRDDFVERFQFQVLENPLLEDKAMPNILVAYDENGQIVGQHLHNPFEYYFKGKQLKGFYGFDFFVTENYRGKGIGSAIARQANIEFNPHFGVGVSDASQRIQLSLGNQIIGYLFTYLWIRNWLSPIKFGMNQLFKQKPDKRSVCCYKSNFPNKISVGDFQFHLVETLEQWDCENWNKDVLEFSRSLNFINWRFLSQENKYFFYLLTGSKAEAYFVVRKIFARGLNLLALVDYRVPEMDEKKFKAILFATQQLAKLGGYDGIFTMSSFHFFDKNLKESYFLKVGKPIVILTNAELDIDLNRIHERKDILATMADSDLDFYFKFQEVD